MLAIRKNSYDSPAAESLSDLISLRYSFLVSKSVKLAIEVNIEVSKADFFF